VKVIQNTRRRGAIKNLVALLLIPLSMPIAHAKALNTPTVEEILARYARGDAFNTATNLEANGSKPTGRWQRVVRRPRRAPTLQRSGRIAVPEDRFRGDRKSLAFRSFRQSDPSGGRSPEQPAAAEGSRICCFSFELLSYKASIDLPIPPNRHPSEGVVGYREYRAYAMSPKRPRFVAAKKQSGHGRSR